MDSSASIYTTFILRLYDVFVLGFSNTFVWRCPTSSVLLPFFQQHVGENAHFDVGAGTGYYPANSAMRLAKTTNVAFLDLNPETLVTAQSSLQAAGYKGGIEAVEHNLWDPLPEKYHRRFDSISLFYVLHCLPSPIFTKASQVLAKLVPALAPGGVTYGATILGRGVQHNWLGRYLISVYNRKGIFGNAEDSREGLETALRGLFEDVEIKEVGVVALFIARKPLPSVVKL